MGITAQWIARTGIVRGQIRLWKFSLMKRRMRQTIDFENQKLAGFLEEAVDGLFRLDPNAVAVVAINDERGIAGTEYYDCSLEDKGRMLYHILEDIIMDVTTANALMIRDAISDMEEENDEIDLEDDEIDE